MAALALNSADALPKEMPSRLKTPEGMKLLYDTIRRQASVLFSPDAPPQGVAPRALHAGSELLVGVLSAMAVPAVIEARFPQYKTLDLGFAQMPTTLLIALLATAAGGTMYSLGVMGGHLVLEAAKGVSYGVAAEYGKVLGQKFAA